MTSLPLPLLIGRLYWKNEKNQKIGQQHHQSWAFLFFKKFSKFQTKLFPYKHQTIRLVYKIKQKNT